MRARALVAIAVVTALTLVFGSSSGPAAADTSILCAGYDSCASRAMPDGGYRASSGKSFWQMDPGHNCTNYVAYRLISSGMANVRPWSGTGNAWNWGSANSAITNGTPALGAVAWWNVNAAPARSLGHVAYVERIVSADEIIVSEDNDGGDFHWRRVTRSGSGWPSGFIHLRDLYVGQIVQHPNGAGPNVSWYVGADHRRYWVPDTTTFARLRSLGVVDAGVLNDEALATLPVRDGYVVSALRADLNGDRQTNVQDLAILLSEYGRQSVPLQGSYYRSDINRDGKVGAQDLAQLLSEYGGPGISFLPSGAAGARIEALDQMGAGRHGSTSTSAAGVSASALTVPLSIGSWVGDLAAISIPGIVGVDSNAPVLNGDGRFIAFTSRAPLVPGDNNGVSDVYLIDRIAGTVTWVSQGNGAADAAQPAVDARISRDGEWVAFDTPSALLPEDTNGISDVYLWARTSGELSLVTLGLGGSPAGGASRASAVGAGGAVVFQSEASNLVSGDTNGWADVFVRVGHGPVERISVGPTGAEGDAASFDGSISADGRYVAFGSRAANLVPGDMNDAADVFVRDRSLGTTILASVSATGGGSIGTANSAVISSDGSRVAFDSDGGDLVPGMTGHDRQVYVRDLARATTLLVSAAGTAGGDGDSFGPSFADDGSRVAFQSAAANLVAGDLNGVPDAFLRDLGAGTTQRVSVSPSGEQADASSGQAAISGDGRYVAFASLAGNLSVGDTNLAWDLFLRRVARPTEPAPGSISGRVTDASGAPVAGVDVYAWAASGEGEGTGVQTRSDGTYVITPLRPGSYLVSFSAPGESGLAGSYFPSTYDPRTAAAVAVASGQAVAGVDARLVVGGSISGLVTGVDGAPIAGVSVYADNGDPRTSASVQSAPDGTYTVTGLSPGDYVVRFSSKVESFAGEFYRDSSTAEAARRVPVLLGGTASGVDARLEAGATIAVALTGSDGAPVRGYGTDVDFLVGAASEASSGWFRWAGSSSTSGTLVALRSGVPGRVVIGRGSADTPFVEQYYQSDGLTTSNYLEAGLLMPVAQTPLAVSMTLQTGASISGVVRDVDGTHLGGRQVVAFVDDGSLASRSGFTRADGTYTIQGLLPGAYQVAVAPQTRGQSDVFYGSGQKPAAPNVLVSGTATTSGIDITLSTAFTDVQPTYPFSSYIMWLSDRGISTGWVAADGSAEFRPKAPVTREAMAAFLYRDLVSGGYVAPAASPFTDVPSTYPFFSYVAWLATQGIARGWVMSDGTAQFRPTEAVSREAMAAFLFRAAGSPEYTPPPVSPFTDVPTEHPFYRQIAWLAGQGISTGWAMPDGTKQFRPADAVTREAMAAFLERAESVLDR